MSINSAKGSHKLMPLHKESLSVFIELLNLLHPKVGTSTCDVPERQGLDVYKQRQIVFHNEHSTFISPI